MSLDPAVVGMTFADNPTGTLDRSLADNPRIRFKPEWAETFWMQQAETLAALDPADRDLLSAWLAAIDRIDMVLDLSARAWRVPGDRTIIGVFETGRQQASWLIVAGQSAWVLAQCDDETVSEPCATLAEILQLIDRRLAS